jgi:hypothetical protein
MRGIVPILAVLSIAIAAMMVGMSGFEGAVGQDPTDGLQSDDELESQAGDGPAGGGNFTGDAGGSNDGDIVGVIISAGSSFASFGAFAVLLPLELNRMGFPWFFALPIGLGGQLVASIAIIEAFSGRELT